jgi:hypothetical protein
MESGGSPWSYATGSDMRKDPETLIAQVREIAMALPDVTEKLSHGEPAFFVKKRLFAMMDNNHHGSGHVAVWCNAPPGAQDALVAAEPKHFFVPPYVGKGGWVGMRLDSGLKAAAVADILRQAHATTAVKKKRVL